jgi:hypothetical protein
MNDSFIVENAYALLIGVGGTGVEITTKDATDIGKVLCDSGLAGYPPKQVITLTEQVASRENVIQALRELTRLTKDKEDATVLIYYSGHGGQYLSAVSGQQDYYLLTHGFDQNKPDDTMIASSEFTKMIDGIQAKKLLVLLDCCHAAGMKWRGGEVSKKSVAAQVNETPAVTGVAFIKELKAGTGRVFISSCAANEQSVILPDATNSLFTEVMLEALEGKASGNEPYVHLIDIMYHLLKEVPKRISRYNHPQHPVINEVIDLNTGFYMCLNGQDRPVSHTAQYQTKEGSTRMPVSAENSEKIDFITNYPAAYKVGMRVTNQKEVKEQINIDISSGSIIL